MTSLLISFYHYREGNKKLDNNLEQIFRAPGTDNRDTKVSNIRNYTSTNKQKHYPYGNEVREKIHYILQKIQCYIRHRRFKQAAPKSVIIDKSISLTHLVSPTKIQSAWV